MFLRARPVKVAKEEGPERDIPRTTTFLLHPAVPLAPRLRGQPRVAEMPLATKRGPSPGPASPKHPPVGSQRPHGTVLGVPPVTHFPERWVAQWQGDTWLYSEGSILAQPN